MTVSLSFGHISRDFPILHRRMHGKRLVYLDSASTSQKPKQVLDAMNSYYASSNANIHRGVYQLSAEATELYEQAHEKTAGFIDCSAREVVFTRNTTEALNLVMYSYGLEHVKRGDNVVVSVLEHHSNFVPWQQLCARVGAELRVVDILSDGTLGVDVFSKAVDNRTKIVAVTQMSNVLGGSVDVRSVGDLVHSYGGILVVDGAQSVPHMPVSVRKLGCDFIAFSGHKMLGPTGIGVLYGREELLRAMPPFLFGGDMIRHVTVEKTTWNELPWKFEAGTPNIAGAIGLGAAVDYLQKIGIEAVCAHEIKLAAYARSRLSGFSDVTLYPNSLHGCNKNENERGIKTSSQRRKKITNASGGILSFNVAGVHAHDVATILASNGVCVRAGHHCCQPLMKRLGVPATVRASFYIYNTKKDVDALCSGLERVRRVFGR